MTAMTTRVREVPYGRPLTVADLEEYFDGGFPTDGRRYELIDGVLTVSPAPIPLHQVVAGALLVRLTTACPNELRALIAPVDVVLDDHTVVQPDVIVARKSDFTDKNLPTAPMLAVEVLSPATRTYDLHQKKDRLARAGCEHYWVVDPRTPSITAWRLVDGEYVVAAEVDGHEVFSVTEPLEVSFTPAELLD